MTQGLTYTSEISGELDILASFLISEGLKKLSPSGVSTNLIKEFLLYGFTEATGHRFVTRSGRLFFEERAEPMCYNTNNNLMALSDENGDLYIRSVQKQFDPLEKTVLELGYKKDESLKVPHSCGDAYNPERLGYILLIQHHFVINSDKLSFGNNTYPPRDPSLPEIKFDGTFFIPGDKDKRILLQEDFSPSKTTSNQPSN